MTRSRQPAQITRIGRHGTLDFAQDDDDAVHAHYLRMKNFWLVKQEPSSYSWSDFVAGGPNQLDWRAQLRARETICAEWQKDDEVLFYHSGEDKAVVGIAKVIRTAYRDSTAKEGDWSTVDLAASQTAAPVGHASRNQKPFPAERNTAGPPVAFVSYAVGGVGISRDCEDGEYRSDSAFLKMPVRLGPMANSRHKRESHVVRLLPCSKAVSRPKIPRMSYNCGNGVPLRSSQLRAATRDLYGRLLARRRSSQSANRKHNHFRTGSARGKRLFSSSCPDYHHQGLFTRRPTICVVATRLGSGRS